MRKAQFTAAGLIALAFLAPACSKKSAEAAPASGAAETDEIVARLRADTADHPFSLGGVYYTIDDVRFDAAIGVLIIGQSDEDSPLGVYVNEIPMREIVISPGFGANGAIAGLAFLCPEGESCIRETLKGPLEGMTDSRLVETAEFGCDSAKCQNIIDDLNALLKFANSASQAESAAAPARLGSAETEKIIRRLKADALNFRFTRDSGSAAVDHWLVDLRYDAARRELSVLATDEGVENAPVKVWFAQTLPLGKIRAELGADEKNAPAAFIIECENGESCISSIFVLENGAPAYADPPEKSAIAAYGCAAAKCGRIIEDINRLAADDRAEELDALNDAMAGGGGTAPQSRSASTRNAAKSASRAVIQSAQKVNSRIDRSAAAVPGLLPTQGVIATADGRIRLHTDSCAASPKGCAADAISDNEVSVEFAAADIAPGSIAMQGTPTGAVVIFSCRPGPACIRSPDGRVQLSGYGLPCKDATECNRLVGELSSLISLAAGQ